MPALPRVDRIKTVYSAAKGLNYAWRFTDYLKTPMYNGVSRYIPQLHRITFRFCKKDESSAGMRNFIQENIVKLGEQVCIVFERIFRRTEPICGHLFPAGTKSDSNHQSRVRKWPSRSDKRKKSIYGRY